MLCWFHSRSSSETSWPYKSPNAPSSSCPGNKALLGPVLWEEWLRSGVWGLVSWGWSLREQELPELLALQHPSKTKFCHSHRKIISCKHILCITWKEHPCIAEDFHKVPLYYFMSGSRLCGIGAYEKTIILPLLQRINPYPLRSVSSEIARHLQDHWEHFHLMLFYF